jgi:hypothetical protein
MTTLADAVVAVELVGTTATDLIDVCTGLKDSVATGIATAVATSENAAILPLFGMTTNLVTLNTTLINFIAGSQPS